MSNDTQIGLVRIRIHSDTNSNWDIELLIYFHRPKLILLLLLLRLKGILQTTLSVIVCYSQSLQSYFPDTCISRCDNHDNIYSFPYYCLKKYTCRGKLLTCLKITNNKSVLSNKIFRFTLRMLVPFLFCGCFFFVFFLVGVYFGGGGFGNGDSFVS